MSRRMFLVLPLGLAAVSACMAGIATNRYTLSVRGDGREGYLAVRRGELAFGRSTFGLVSDNRDAADRWYIDGTRIKSSVGGGYLAYDPSGKDTRVFLVSRPGKGTEWSVGRARREGERGTIRAAAGAMKGWYLETQGGKLLLSRTPARSVEAGRIYEHK